MTALLVLACFVIGALWRRGLGGWLGLPRWAWVAAMFPLSWLVSLPLAPPWQYAAMVTITGLSAAYWLPGHDWTNLRALWHRYGVLGLAWHLSQRWWPREWRLGGFVDGAISVAELLAGGLWWGSWAALLSI